MENVSVLLDDNEHFQDLSHGICTFNGQNFNRTVYGVIEHAANDKLRIGSTAAIVQNEIIYATILIPILK